MRAGFYECDVTPPLGGFTPGNAAKKVAMDVNESLHVRAVVIEQDGEIAAMVAADILNVPKEMHDIVTKRIYEYTGIEPSRVCITANHNHRGAPVLDSALYGGHADSTYKDVFFRRAADCVTLAYKRLKEVKMKFGKQEVHGVSFNRDYVFEDGTMGTNMWKADGIVGTLAGIDPDLSVITFEHEGEPIGSIINFACHQACVWGDVYSGDYSSIMSKELKNVYGQDYVSLFVIGTCGDINHVDRKNFEATRNSWRYKEIGKILATAVTEAVASSEYTDGAVAVIKESIRINTRTADDEYLMREIPRLATSESMGLTRLRNLIAYNAAGVAPYFDLYVQGIKLGDDTCIYILPGEIYVNYGLDIKTRSKFKHNLVVELSNSQCGYVPTKEAFPEYNPKSDLYEPSLTTRSCLVPEAGQMLVEKALEIGEKLRS